MIIFKSKRTSALGKVDWTEMLYVHIKFSFQHKIHLILRMFKQHEILSVYYSHYSGETLDALTYKAYRTTALCVIPCVLVQYICEITLHPLRKRTAHAPWQLWISLPLPEEWETSFKMKMMHYDMYTLSKPSSNHNEFLDRVFSASKSVSGKEWVFYLHKVI